MYHIKKGFIINLFLICLILSCDNLNKKEESEKAAKSVGKRQLAVGKRQLVMGGSFRELTVLPTANLCINF